MPLTLAELEYEGVVGSGAFAIVKRYRKRSDGALVAIKTLTSQEDDSRRRFLREIELLRDLHPHPNVIALLGTDEDGGRPAYIMPLAESNLEEHVRRRNNRLTQDERTALFLQTCRAMAHAHERGVLHRDLAPRNVLVFEPTAEPVVRVADFGLGRDMRSTSSRGGSIDQAVGHFAYVAPEQRADLASATTRSDVYSLGRLLRFIMTGRDPDASGSSVFAHVVATSTQVEPSRRYPDARDLLRAFEDMVTLLSPISSALDLTTLTAHSEELDWRLFHDAVIAQPQPGHVYYTFLGPVTAYLGQGRRLSSYADAVGPGFDDFLRTYVDRMESCLPLTGWPFSAMDAFGRCLNESFRATRSPASRKIALGGLWMLAFEQDQWAVQDIVRGLLHAETLDPELDEMLAARIMASGTRFEPNYFGRTVLGPRMHAAIASTSHR